LALGARDRAMLLLGFGAALRLGDVDAVPGRGLRVRVRRSKSDQHGQGHELAVWANPAEPGFCAAAALGPGCAPARRHRTSPAGRPTPSSPCSAP
jgi:hypothetical protein